jgi:hypothetical protein
MHTTLPAPGNPVLQLVALAFQSITPVLGPTQLSVHAARAPAGVATTPATAPATPNEPSPTNTETAIRCTPRMDILVTFRRTVRHAAVLIPLRRNPCDGRQFAPCN